MLQRGKNFIKTWTRTTLEIWKAFFESADREDISKLSLLLSALKQASSWAYFLIATEIFDALQDIDTSKDIKNEVSDKVAVLIPGYNLTDKSLIELRKELQSRGIQVETIPDRLMIKSEVLDIYRKIWDIIDNNDDKKKVLFWYSSGGIIAHKVGKNKNIPSVSYATPDNTDNTMISALLEFYGRSPKKQIQIPQGSINIIEWFSEMTPHTGDIPERTEVMDGVHTHMSIHQKKVVKKIADEIEERFSVND